MDKQIVQKNIEVLDLYVATPIVNLINDLIKLKDAGWADVCRTGLNCVALRLETDDELSDRMLIETHSENIEKEKRRKQYLLLKEEFGE